MYSIQNLAYDEASLKISGRLSIFTILQTKQNIVSLKLGLWHTRYQSYFCCRIDDMHLLSSSLSSFITTCRPIARSARGQNRKLTGKKLKNKNWLQAYSQSHVKKVTDWRAACNGKRCDVQAYACDTEQQWFGTTRDNIVLCSAVQC